MTDFSRGGHDIDPNATLMRMVELARVVQHTADPEPSPAQDAAFSLAEQVIDMHEWLSKGGFLPSDWFGERRDQGTRCPQHKVPFHLVHTVDAAERWICPMGCLMTIWTGKNGHGDLLKHTIESSRQDDQRPLKDASKICGYQWGPADSTVTVVCSLDQGHAGPHTR